MNKILASLSLAVTLGLSCSSFGAENDLPYRIEDSWLTPTREYSVQEIDDAVEVIALLSELPFTNANVGMWGISWGGFNAIQTALRSPPQLKGVLAAHASDDLYSNDVHYTDGIFGIDEYILSINYMTGFMRSGEMVGRTTARYDGNGRQRNSIR
ncbi:MAG: putative acyl esterase [Pseudohongiellaceae bacterium]